MKPQTGAQDTTTCALQYSEVDGRIAQYDLCRLRTRHIALHCHFTVDKNTARRGHTDNMAAGFHNVGEHAGGGGFAVGACDRRHGYTARYTWG